MSRRISIKPNIYVGQRLFCSNVNVCTHTHTGPTGLPGLLKWSVDLESLWDAVEIVRSVNRQPRNNTSHRRKYCHSVLTEPFGINSTSQPNRPYRLNSCLELKFHETSFLRSILVSDIFARILTRMSGVSGVSARMSRGCYEETGVGEASRSVFRGEWSSCRYSWSSMRTSVPIKSTEVSQRVSFAAEITEEN